MAHGKPFLGAETLGGDVLIIDQDTPTLMLKNRLAAMAKAIGGKLQHNIVIHSMEGLSLRDTLPAVIGQYPASVLILIDNLNSVTAGVANAADELMRFKTQCLRPNRTILTTYHTPPTPVNKKIKDIWFGSSELMQQADSYFFLSKEGQGALKTLHVRPVAKRQPIEYSNVTLDFHDENGMWFEFNKEEQEEQK